MLYSSVLLWTYKSMKGGIIMSKFEERGIERQYGARTINAAKKALHHSCTICSTIGRRSSCKGCVIAGVHRDVITFVLTN